MNLREDLYIAERNMLREVGRGFSHAIVLICVSATILVLAMQHSLLAGLGLFGVLGRWLAAGFGAVLIGLYFLIR